MSMNHLPRTESGNARERGVSLVEFALALPFLIWLISGVFDLGFAVYASNTVALAAREGARTAILLSKTDSDICTQARNAIQGFNVTCTVSPSPSRTTAQPVSVTISYSWTPFTPLIGNILGGGSMTLSSRATMQVE